VGIPCGDTGPARMRGLELLDPATGSDLAEAWRQEHAFRPLDAELVVGRLTSGFLSDGLKSPEFGVLMGLMVRFADQAWMATHWRRDGDRHNTVWVPTRTTARLLREGNSRLRELGGFRRQWRSFRGVVSLFPGWFWFFFWWLLLFVPRAIRKSELALRDRALAAGMAEDASWTVAHSLGSDDFSLLAGMLWHEAGHVRLMDGLDAQSVLALSNDWDSPLGKEIEAAGGHAVSLYALSSPSEAFAESYALYRLAGTGRLPAAMELLIERVLAGELPVEEIESKKAHELRLAGKLPELY